MTRQEALTQLDVTYCQAHPTSLSHLSEAEWSQVSNRWSRGIDWNVHKAGSRWEIGGEHFQGFPLFRTKTAAYNAAETLILAESRWRGYQRLRAEMSA